MNFLLFFFRKKKLLLLLLLLYKFVMQTFNKTNSDSKVHLSKLN